MPVPVRRMLKFQSTTISLSPQLRKDLQQIADRQLSSLAHVLRQAALMYVAAEKAHASGATK